VQKTPYTSVSHSAHVRLSETSAQWSLAVQERVVSARFDLAHSAPSMLLLRGGVRAAWVLSLFFSSLAHSSVVHAVVTFRARMVFPVARWCCIAIAVRPTNFLQGASAQPSAAQLRADTEAAAKKKAQLTASSITSW
jgi:hypothetical protein